MSSSARVHPGLPQLALGTHSRLWHSDLTLGMWRDSTAETCIYTVAITEPGSPDADDQSPRPAREPFRGPSFIASSTRASYNTSLCIWVSSWLQSLLPLYPSLTGSLKFYPGQNSDSSKSQAQAQSIRSSIPSVITPRILDILTILFFFFFFTILFLKIFIGI